MGTITMALKKVLDTERDSGNGFRIGLDDYPIFDAAYRDGLNRKIINHYYNREIGLETISLFSFNLRRKMWEIMPLYNQVYKSTQIQFDPLATFDLHTVRDDTGSETGHNTTATNATAGTVAGSRTVNSDTPQTQLSEDEDYATSGTDANSTSSSNNTTNGVGDSTTNSNANATSSTTGFQGSAADLLMKYRATLINTDMMIVNELAELFMGVYDNGYENLPSFGMHGGLSALGGYGYGW